MFLRFSEIFRDFLCFSGLAWPRGSEHSGLSVNSPRGVAYLREFGAVREIPAPPLACSENSQEGRGSRALPGLELSRPECFERSPGHRLGRRFRRHFGDASLIGFTRFMGFQTTRAELAAHLILASRNSIRGRESNKTCVPAAEA